jgi:hypothetical protein
MKNMQQMFQKIKEFPWKSSFSGAFKTLSFKNGSTISSLYSWLMMIYEILFLLVLSGGNSINLSFSSIFLGFVFFSILANILFVKIEFVDTFDLIWPAVSLILLLIFLFLSILHVDLGTGKFLSSLISLDLIKNLIKNVFDSKKKEKSISTDKQIDEIYKKIVIQNKGL